MASSLLNIGQSALFAAQAQLATTSHNIANAGTPGYSRQVVQQASAGAQDQGNGFIGQGTTVNSVTRVSDGFLTQQILSAQTSASSYTAYSSEISQIDNVVDDTSAGLTPALQTFFAGLNDLSANPDTDASRQAVLSNSQILAARFQSLSATLTDSENSVNGQIKSNVISINSYATQIAALNQAINTAQASTGQPPNDLLDQRDQLVAQLNQVVKVTTLPQQNGGVDVLIGNGQPLVLGNQVSTVVALPSKDDPSTLQLGISVNNNTTIALPDSSITGGTLGGLMDYRSQTLDVVKNTLGQLATTIASSMNAQNELGLDQNGNPGGPIFNVSPPTVIGRTGNSTTAQLTASMTDASKLTTSDYRMQFDGTNYTITRLSDGNTTTIPGPPTTYPSPPPEVDGVTFSSPTMAAGDSFTVKPTADAAASLSVTLANISGIAAAAPITTAFASTNTGTGTVSAGSVDKKYLSTPPTLPLTATFGAGTPPTGFVLTDGAKLPNTVTTGVTVNGVAVTGSPITYTAGDTITYGGVSFSIGGAPAATDKFTVSANTNATKDNRNIQAMAALQTTNTIGGANGTTFQGAYSSLVALVGNKTNEVQVLGAAEQSRVDSVTTAQQSETGVNSDEELTNMIRYQTAYQAGAKIIQAASDMLNVLFTLGN